MTHAAMNHVGKQPILVSDTEDSDTAQDQEVEYERSRPRDRPRKWAAYENN